MLLSVTADGWAPKVLFAHDKYASGSWSGPGGWAKVLKRQLHRIKNNSGSSAAPSLSWGRWFALTLPSLLVFIAMPLSGLSFEAEPGFIWDLDASKGPNITGFTYANFNERHGYEAASGASNAWKNAVDARVPGMGIIYTSPGGDPIAPGALPKDKGLPKVFLTAQAETPIDGISWGLNVEYNCAVVDKLSDLTVLKLRKNLTKVDMQLGMNTIFEVADDGGYISRMN